MFEILQCKDMLHNGSNTVESNMETDLAIMKKENLLKQ